MTKTSSPPTRSPSLVRALSGAELARVMADVAAAPVEPGLVACLTLTHLLAGALGLTDTALVERLGPAGLDATFIPRGQHRRITAAVDAAAEGIAPGSGPSQVAAWIRHGPRIAPRNSIPRAPSYVRRASIRSVRPRPEGTAPQGATR